MGPDWGVGSDGSHVWGSIVKVETMRFADGVNMGEEEKNQRWRLRPGSSQGERPAQPCVQCGLWRVART